jgi:hypothetical protein
MTNTNPIDQHTEEILALAMAKHASAIEAMQRRPINFEAARRAAADLADAALLAEDAVYLTGDARLAASLAQLQEQRAMLDQWLARMQASPPVAPSPWTSPWPWINLFALVIIAVLIVT